MECGAIITRSFLTRMLKIDTQEITHKTKTWCVTTLSSIWLHVTRNNVCCMRIICYTCSWCPVDKDIADLSAAVTMETHLKRNMVEITEHVRLIDVIYNVYLNITRSYDIYPICKERGLWLHCYCAVNAIKHWLYKILCLMATFCWIWICLYSHPLRAWCCVGCSSLYYVDFMKPNNTKSKAKCF